MRRIKSVSGLVAINLVLLALLVLTVTAPRSVGSGDAAHLGGDYLMVGGQVQGSTTHALYVLDQRRGMLLAMTYDRTSKKMKPIGARSLAADDVRSEPSR